VRSRRSWRWDHCTHTENGNLDPGKQSDQRSWCHVQRCYVMNKTYPYCWYPWWFSTLKRTPRQNAKKANILDDLQCWRAAGKAELRKINVSGASSAKDSYYQNRSPSPVCKYQNKSCNAPWVGLNLKAIIKKMCNTPSCSLEGKNQAVMDELSNQNG